jgi:hypothetical protein
MMEYSEKAAAVASESPNAHRKDAPHVNFERPLEVRVMTIDGTWCGECLLIDISDTEAHIEVVGHSAELSEFFLLLTRFGNPVFRRCKREWVRGAKMGISFKKTNIGIKSSKEAPREQSGIDRARSV